MVRRDQIKDIYCNVKGFTQDAWNVLLAGLSDPNLKLDRLKLSLPTNGPYSYENVVDIFQYNRSLQTLVINVVGFAWTFESCMAFIDMQRMAEALARNSVLKKH